LDFADEMTAMMQQSKKDGGDVVKAEQVNDELLRIDPPWIVHQPQSNTLSHEKSE
jgi:hypothetical protein